MVSDDAPSSIPTRIAQLAKTHLPGETLTAQFWRQVDAEIVATFRADIADPLYDRWLSLHLKYIHAVGRNAPSPDVYYSFEARARRLLEKVAAKERRAKSPQSAAEVAFLRDQILDQKRVWRTDFYSTRLDRSDEHFIREVVRRAALLPEESFDADRIEKQPVPRSELFDRLPLELMHFVNHEFRGRVRDAQFWNRMRDKVSAHFDPAWLESPEYRAYLRLLVRHHGFREGAKLLPEVRTFLKELETGAETDPTWTSPAGIAPDVLRMKAEDLARQIEDSLKSGSERPRKRNRDSNPGSSEREL